MSSKCKCVGCLTQCYYDEVRSNREESGYEVTVTSRGQLGNTSFHRKLDLYEYYNIISEYFNVEVELPTCKNECNGDCCG